ncbi:MAG: hypothetical protein V4581_02185 [Bacteroidota bacterium]
MKKILLLLLFTAPIMAQNGFKMEDGSIVWERFYNAPNTDIKSLIATNEKLSLISDAEDTYIGVGEGVHNTCASGSVLMKCDTNFSFIIMKVADGYLVKVKDFRFLEKYGPMQLRIIPTSLEKYYLEYGKIRTTPKTQTDLACVENFLAGVFSGKTVPAESPALTSN